MSESVAVPKVSIIVPVYNAEKHIERCVNSILAQEYQDLELILVDDGSVDGSPAICDAYARQDPRVHVIHKENGGVSTARNTGIEAAHGDYLEFLDADDWITNDATKLLVRAMEENRVDMVIADFFRVVGGRVAQKSDIDEDRAITREEYADHMMETPADFYWGVCWNKLYKRSIVESYKVRMDPSISWSEDFIFNMEYVLHCRSIFPLHAPVYYYVKTEGSLVETQSSGFGSMLRMKLGVIEYYRNFYKNVYDESDYQSRSLALNTFFLVMAADGNATPFLPGTKRLGTERPNVHANRTMRATPLVEARYFELLLDSYLSVVATQFKLDLVDVCLVAYVDAARQTGSIDDVAEFLGVSPRAARASVRKLVMRKLVEVEQTGPKLAWLSRDDSDEVTADRSSRLPQMSLCKDASQIVIAIENAYRDFDAVRYAGFSEDDADVLRDAVRRSTYNVRDRLSD